MTNLTRLRRDLFAFYCEANNYGNIYEERANGIVYANASYTYTHGRGGKHTCEALMAFPTADSEPRFNFMQNEGETRTAVVSFTLRLILFFDDSAAQLFATIHIHVPHLALNLSRGRIIYNALTAAFNASIDREILSSNIRATSRDVFTKRYFWMHILRCCSR